MALVVPNLGELELLDKLIKDQAHATTDENYILKLYTNDYVPAADSTPGSFTQATFTNYTVKTLTRAGWNAAATVGTKAESSYGTVQTWTCGATGQTIYGYYIVGSVSTVVLWAERFGVARALADQDVLNLTPKFSLSSE